MESIDSLAKAINQFEGGVVLVSHDMRLISQVAREIWLCDNLTVSLRILLFLVYREIVLTIQLIR